MDERFDLVRSVTDGRYVYIRNYRPDKIYGQHIDYMFQTPTTRVWKRLHDDGKLTPAQDTFWKTKQPEELYDLQADPDEINNLAASPDHADTLKKLRAALREHTARIRDVGFLPEGEMNRRSAGTTPYDLGHDPAKYPFERILDTAELASLLKPEAIPALQRALTDSDNAVRYWAVLGLLMRGAEGVNAAHGELVKALEDAPPDVRIAAAEALGRYGSEADVQRVLPLLGRLADWSKNDVFTTMAALNALDALGPKAASLRDRVSRLPAKGPVPDARYSSYVPRLLEDLTAALKPRP